MRADPQEEAISVLVTGGAGFIGTHLCRELIASGHEVISLDIKNPTPQPVKGVNYVAGDARDFITVQNLMKRYKTQAVYHLAATVSVPLCQKDPSESYSHNVSATLAVLEACRLSLTPVRIAFASSAALYGSLGDSRQPLAEGVIASQFSSFYAAQKHASEKMIELFSQYYQIPALIFRFFNVYGIGQDPDSPYSGVITIFSTLAKENRPMILYNEGKQTRDFIPVTDIAKTLTKALHLPESNWNASVVNLGSGTSTSVRELAEIIKRTTGSASEITSAPPREGDVLHSLADISRAQALLGFKPSTNLQERLAELLS